MSEMADLQQMLYALITFGCALGIFGFVAFVIGSFTKSESTEGEGDHD